MNVHILFQSVKSEAKSKTAYTPLFKERERIRLKYISDRLSPLPEPQFDGSLKSYRAKIRRANNRSMRY